MTSQLDYYKAQFEKLLTRPGPVNDILTLAEQKTQVKKVYIAYGVLSVIVLWLMFGFGAQLLCNFIGFLYPAYMSIKALESRDKDDDTQWLMYWVVFAVFSVVEFFSDILVGWVPFYWLLKCAFLLWCMSPLEGSTIIYNRIILPYFLKHESVIDDAVRKGKEGFGKIANTAVEKAKDFAAEQQLQKDN